MAINNTPKPTGSINNTAKPSSTTVNNQARPVFQPLWVSTVLPWQLSTPWLTFGEISNVSKPTP